jgi:hypothetical protein
LKWQSRRQPWHPKRRPNPSEASPLENLAAMDRRGNGGGPAVHVGIFSTSTGAVSDEDCSGPLVGSDGNAIVCFRDTIATFRK